VSAGPTDGVRAAAPAKLNLFLRVVGKRADGYHLLDSLVVFAEFGDSVTAAPADELYLELTGPFAATLTAEPDNLVLRAARALQKATGTAKGAHLTLDKHLPVASGIGGGSSDAAAALRALNRVWGLGLGSEALAEIGFTLGADIAVCVHAEARRMSGVGEVLEPVAGLQSAPLLMVNPGIGLPTAPVFKTRGGPFSEPFGALPATLDAASLARIVAEAGNDLTAPASALCPAVLQVIQAIAAEPGCLAAAMSGSGATCFGIFADDASAARAGQALAARQPGWWVLPTRIAGA
jgi:4-diphosphocytidyl-2-C-methyl-D-erythritol kinase